MNSLNILSSRVSPAPTPDPSRTNSLSSLGLAVSQQNSGYEKDDTPGRSSTQKRQQKSPSAEDDGDNDEKRAFTEHDGIAGERTPLLAEDGTPVERSRWWRRVPRTVLSAFIGSLRWLLSTMATPGVYLIACLYDDGGAFAPFRQFRRLFGVYNGNAYKMTSDYQKANVEKDAQSFRDSSMRHRSSGKRDLRPRLTSVSSSAVSTESESEGSRRSSRRHSRNQSLRASEEIAPARRSIRIKLHNDEALRERKHKRAQSSGKAARESSSPADISAQLKSPTSPVGALTRYPKTPAPPRPLVPRRQPSYLNIETVDDTHKKTLILDLDETLIHSMSKGGRMNSGHMVEVRLNTTYVGSGGHTAIGPQHPILYWVNKRPHCDDFLRRVSLFHCLQSGL